MNMSIGVAYPAHTEGGWSIPYFLPRLFLFLCGLVLLLAVVPAFGPVVFIALVLYALLGTRQSIEALALLAFFIIANKAVMGIEVSIFRWLILFAAFGRMLWDGFINHLSTPPVLKPLLIFAITVVLFSLLTSQFPAVSVLKIVSFTMGVSTILVGFHRTADLKAYWLSWFITLILFIQIASLPLLGSSVGYVRNEQGFQGMFSHPQIYGTALAPTTAFLTGLFLFGKTRSWVVVVGIGLGWLGVFASLSRTALLSMGAGLFFVVLVGSLKGKSWLPAIGHALTQTRALLLLLLATVFIVLNWSSFQNRVTSFLLKDEGATSVTASLKSARSYLIENSMDNFWTAPLTGIGFGVPSDPSSFDNRLETGPLGLPIGASVEKGFMPSAVLEETGIVGALLVILLILFLMRPVVQEDNIPLFWMLSTCLFVNLGEMVFFSVGGMGLYLWLLMGLCYGSSVKNRPRTRPE